MSVIEIRLPKGIDLYAVAISYKNLESGKIWVQASTWAARSKAEAGLMAEEAAEKIIPPGWEQAAIDVCLVFPENDKQLEHLFPGA